MRAEKSSSLPLLFLALAFLGALAMRASADARATAEALLAPATTQEGTADRRAAGLGGALANAALLEQQARLVAGRDAKVFRQAFLVTVPEVDRCRMTVSQTQAGSGLTGDLRVWALEPMGGQLPGLHGPEGVGPADLPVVYGGRGRLEDFKGKPIAGSLVALELGGEAEAEGWERAAALGAAGVIYLDGPMRATAVDFLDRSTTLPLSLPRLYTDDPALVQALRSGESPRVSVELSVSWRERRAENVICVLPGRTESGGDAQWINRWVILQARYDGVSPVMERSPGATQAMNAGVLMDLAGRIGASPSHRGVVLAWTAGDAWNYRGTRELLDLLNRGTRTPAQAAGYAQTRLREAQGALDEAQLVVRQSRDVEKGGWMAGASDRTRTVVEEQLLRESSRVEAQLEQVRSEGAGERESAETLKVQKRELQAAISLVNGRSEEGDHSAAQARVRAAAAVAAARWEADLARLAQERDLLENWPAIRTAMPAGDPLLFLSVALTGGEAGAGAPAPRWGLLSRSFYSTGLDASADMQPFLIPFRRYVAGSAFLPESIEKTRALETLLPVKEGFSSDAAISRGMPAAAAATLLDAMSAQDTPADTADRINWPAVDAQERDVAAFLLGSAKLADGKASPGALTDEQFNPRADGIAMRSSDQKLTLFERAAGENLPKLRAAQALVGGESEIWNRVLGGPLAGTRRTEWYLTHADGTVVMRGLTRAQEAAVRLQAFEFDGAGRAVKALAANLQETGGMAADFVPGDTPVRATVFDCAPREGTGDFGKLDAYGLYDPRHLDVLASVQVFDARRMDDAPLRSIYARDGKAVMFFPPPPETRWQLLASAGQTSTRRLIVINADAEHPTGTGFGTTDLAKIGPLPWRGAQDYVVLDQQRKNELEKFGISNEVIRELHDASKEHLQDARDAEQKKDYPQFMDAARGLWALQAQEHDNLINTANGIIKGVIFLLLGVIPFSYFLERLLIGSPNVYRQIAWFGLIFACMTGGLWFHPAFRISSSPLMILLAFFILILSSTVVYILWGKFEEEIRRLRGSAGDMQHVASFRRGAVMGAAIRLGLSNMRRRAMRTTLTLVTLVLLTFTLLCFTSVRESVQVAPYPVRYFSAPGPGGAHAGIPPASVLLCRDGWTALPGEVLEMARGMAVRGSAGEAREPLVAGRWWYSSEDPNQGWLVPVEAGAGGRYAVAGLVGVEPSEDAFQAANAITGRLSPESCWLPAASRESLKIKPGDEVRVMGFALKVAGFFTPEQFGMLRQLSGDSFAPRLPETAVPGAGGGRAEGGPLRTRASYKFLDPVSVAIVPARVTRQLGGRLTSVVFSPELGNAADRPAAMESLARDLSRRSAFTLYASTGTRVLAINSTEESRTQDLSTVVVPMVIAGVIVLNTMLGAVSERTREIHVYTSVGLSPTHVGMLFLAEAAALGTLGVVFGYIFGQGLATVLSWTHWLPGVDLNYSSMSAIVTMGLVLGIVMLSSLWPARAASRLAAPSLQRDWKLPRPVGDLLALDLPFTVNETAARGVLAFLAEYLRTTSQAGTGKFTADNLEGESQQTTQGPVRILRARIWLAPYDLGVIQMMQLSIHPTDQHNVFDVHIELTREAGNPSAWRRLNRPFLVEVRRQFLLWRSVDAERMKAYVLQSVQLFGGGETKITRL